MSPTVDYFDDSHGRQVLAIETIRQVTHQDNPQCEIGSFLSSCDASDEKQIQAIRSHWGIENRLHWLLDMSFREDECRISDANADRRFSVLRKIAFNRVRQDSSKRNSIKAKRKKVGWSNDYRENVMFNNFRA